MLVIIASLQPWDGAALNGIRHPRNIEQLWTDEELTNVGLAKPVPFEIPNGKVTTGSVRYVLNDGVVCEEYDIEDAPPPPVPEVISDRQFFHALALGGEITQEEALAAVRTGEIPVALEAIIDQLPSAEKFNAQMLLSGAVEFRRDHPLTTQIGAAMNKTSAQIDDLFRTAAAL